MEKFEEQLVKHLPNMMEVPFSDELQKKILLAAAQQQSVRRRKRNFDWRGLAAGFGGVSAAALMIWAAWNYGSSVPAALSPTMAKSLSADVSSSVLGGNTLGLQLAPISIQSLENVGNEVHATLVNIGTQTFNQQDYVGVLSFQSSSDTNILRATNWITFVDPPKGALAPGETANWSFHPNTAPGEDSVGRLTETPRLVFFKQGMVIPSKADVKWGVAPLTVNEAPSVENIEPLANGKGARFRVAETVQNNSAHTVSLDKCLAIIWFSKNANDDWTAADTIRYIVTLAVPQHTTLVPGQKWPIISHLVGPNPVNTYVHVEFIQR